MQIFLNIVTEAGCGRLLTQAGRDLPLNFHPAAIRASAVDTPFGAV